MNKKIPILTVLGGIISMFFSTVAYTGMMAGVKKGKGGGTITSAFVMLILVILYFCGINHSPLQLLYAAAISFIIGLLFIGMAEKFMVLKWGALVKHTGEEVTSDLNQTTIDELHGMCLSVFPIYFFDFSPVFFVIAHLVAFGVFRFFDVKKIWGIKKIDDQEKIQGKGVSTLFKSYLVMADDSLAGIYSAPVTGIACLILYGIAYITR